MTVQDIRDLLARSDKAIERAIIILYAAQTDDEQGARTTSHSNGEGFNSVDAYILTSFAEQLLGTGTFEMNGRTYTRSAPRHLSDKQLALARTKLYKYAGQLLSCMQPTPEPVTVPITVTTIGNELFADDEPADTEPVDKPADTELIDDTAYVDSINNARAYGAALAGFNSRGERWNRGYVAPKYSRSSIPAGPSNAMTLEDLFKD